MVMIPRSFSLYANSAGDKGFVPMSDGFTPVGTRSSTEPIVSWSQAIRIARLLYATPDKGSADKYCRAGVPPRRIANLAESESVKKSVLTSQKSWSIATTSCLITRPFFAAFGIAEISASVVDKHVCFVDADALTTKMYVPRIPNITITRHCVGGSPKSASVKMNRYKQLRIMSCRLRYCRRTKLARF